MLGIILGLGYAAAFAVSNTITRRGVLRVSSSYIANVSILTGPLFFLVVTLIIGEIFKLGQFPWQSYAFFAGSGIIHFAFGRTFGYRCIQLIGANRANIVTGLSAIVSVLLAIVVLGEVLTPLVAFGIVLSMSGPLLIALKDPTVTSRVKIAVSSSGEEIDQLTSNGGMELRELKQASIPHGKEIDRRTLYLGLLFGVGCSLFWGTSPIFIKWGIENGGSSILGTLTAYAAASLVISPQFLRNKMRQELLTSDWGSLRLALMSGLSTNIAQMLRYTALGFASVITVSLMSRTTPLWSLLLSFIFNRKVESFGRWVLAGNALLFMGSLLVMIGQL